MNLSEFIVKAKKNTYASGNSSTKLEDGLEEYNYVDQKFRYRDRYTAEDPRRFGGEELVWEDERKVWIMNYYGSIVSDKVKSDAIYNFLRKAMAQVNEKNPFRGPAIFKEGYLEYSNISEGDIDDFKGTEKILFRGKLVYQLEYHGGKL